MPMRNAPAGAVMSDFAQDEPQRPNSCPQVAALDRQTAEISRLADAVERAREAFTPAADAVADLGAAQKKLCGFLVKHRVKLLLSIPVVLTAVGAISPTAAEGIRTVLHELGVAAGS